MSAPALQRFLDKLATRSALGEKEQQAILSLPAYPVQVACHRDFVRAGERVDHACLIADGLAGRFGQNRDGQRQIIDLHIPGDMADLHSVVTPGAASSLQALAVRTILKVPHAALRAVAARYPALAEAFWRECVADAAILAEWVVNLGLRNAHARAAHLLCEIACRCRSAEGRVGSSFAFPATQNHLADMLALTPVHVNRTLRSLREEGLADLRHKTLQILDWEGLVDAGEFDPAYLQLGKAGRATAPLSPTAASRQPA